MKKLFLLAWPIALAAVSCSNEEVVSVNNDANEIKFAVVSENATRANAENMFCNANKPGLFNVWALSNQTVEGNTVHNSYFAGVEYSLSGGKWVATDQNNVRFWPNQNAATLDFYAMHNYNDATVQWKADATGSNPRLGVTGYVLSTTLAEQKDFIYSVKTGQSKPAGNQSDITLNFRHALSQVVFQARNTNKSLYIEIGKVTVKNFNSKGDFYLPVATTETNIKDHTAKPAGVPDEATVGTWKNQDVLATTSVDVYPTLNSEGAQTAVTNNYAVVKYSTTAHDGTNLTNGKELTTDSNNKNPGDEGYVETFERDFSKAMLFIPQTRKWEASDVVPSGTDAVKSDATHPYFVITCKIWNVNGATFDKTKDVCIYSGDAYIPVTATWEPGKKYIYTFVFGGKNGGYDPDGKDVLVPISFDITVDDFTPVVEGEVNMFQ